MTHTWWNVCVTDTRDTRVGGKMHRTRHTWRSVMRFWQSQKLLSDINVVNHLLIHNINNIILISNRNNCLSQQEHEETFCLILWVLEKHTNTGEIPSTLTDNTVYLTWGWSVRQFNVTLCSLYFCFVFYWMMLLNKEKCIVGETHWTSFSH